MIPNDLILKCFEEHENVLNLSAVMEEVQLILSILPLSL